MNILYYCRKFIEKSRSFAANHFNGARIDIFLFIAVLAVLVIAVSGRLYKESNKPRSTDIFISPQYETLFGRDIFGALIQEFEEQNPDLRIQTACGDGADIIFFDDSEIAEITAASSLASLKPYIHSETRSGEWAIPLVFFMDLFFYNIDILEAANCDRPPKTRAEFLAAAKAIAALNGVSPLATGLSRTDPMALRSGFYPWIWAAGGDLRTPGAENVTLSRAANEAIDFFALLYNEGLLAPDCPEKTCEQRLAEFAEGKAAMMAASSRDIPFLRHAAPTVNFGITAMPQTVPGQNHLGLTGIYAGISAGCALPEEAWTFLAFIAGRKQILEEALGAVPGSFPGAFPAAYILNDPLYSKAWDIFEAADIVEYYPADPVEEETSRIIREKLAEILKK